MPYHAGKMPVSGQSFELAHRPEIVKGQQYIQWTEHHQLAAQGMSPCALRLWQYLLTKYPGGVPQELELEEVRYEISVGRSKVYSVQSLKNAIAQHLVPKGLLMVVKKFTAKIMRVVANHAGAVKPIANKFVKPQGKLRFDKEICEIDTSNPDSVVPSYKDFQKATNSPIVVEEKKVEEEEAISISCTNVPAEDEYIEEVEQDSVKDVSRAAQSRFEKLEIDKQIEEMGIKQNDTIDTLIDETDNQILRDAVAAAKVYIEKNGTSINAKAAVVVKAIQRKWQPNRSPNVDLTLFKEIDRPTDEQLHQLRSARDRGEISEFKMLEVIGQTGCKTFHVNGKGRWIPWREYLGK